MQIKSYNEHVKSPCDKQVLKRNKRLQAIHKCVICEDRFKDVEQLNDHKLTHYLEDSYNCKHCKFSFSQIAAWKRHNCVHKKPSDLLEVTIKQEIPLDIYDEID